MKIWIIRTVGSSNIRIARDAGKAYMICKSIIQNLVPIEDRVAAEGELRFEFERYPVFFGCDNVCSAEMYKVE